MGKQPSDLRFYRFNNILESADEWERQQGVLGHVLSDLRVLGVEITDMIDVTPADVELANRHDLESQGFS